MKPPDEGLTIERYVHTDLALKTKGCRKLIEGSYRTVYQVLEDRLVVLTVFEVHHLLPVEKVENFV